MSKITLIYDTETEEIMAMEDGKTIANVSFAAFDANDGATIICKEGIKTSKANPSQCRPGESMEDCRKRLGSNYKTKASPMRGDMGLMEKKMKTMSIEELIREKTGGLSV